MAVNPPSQVVIAGERNDTFTKEMIGAIRSTYQPLRVTLLHDPNENLASVAPIVKDKEMVNKKATVYVCENFACRAPITDREELTSLWNK